MLASNVSSHSSKFKSTFLCKECSLRIAFIHILTLDCAEVQFNMSAVSELQYYGLSRVYLCFPPPPVWCVMLWCFSSGKAGLPDPEVLVERLLKRRTFRPDPQRTSLMFAFFAQHFTHQFFKTFNRMGLGFTKAVGHGVSPS